MYIFIYNIYYIFIGLLHIYLYSVYREYLTQYSDETFIVKIKSLVVETCSICSALTCSRSDPMFTIQLFRKALKAFRKACHTSLIFMTALLTVHIT